MRPKPLGIWAFITLFMLIAYRSADFGWNLEDAIGEWKLLVHKAEEGVDKINHSQFLNQLKGFEKKLEEEAKKMSSSKAMKDFKKEVAADIKSVEKKVVKKINTNTKIVKKAKEVVKKVKPLATELQKDATEALKSEEFEDLKKGVKNGAIGAFKEIGHEVKVVADAAFVRTDASQAESMANNPLNCTKVEDKDCPHYRLAVNRARYSMDSMRGQCKCNETSVTYMKTKIIEKNEEKPKAVLLCPVRRYKVNESKTKFVYLSSQKLVDQYYQVVHDTRCPEEGLLVSDGTRVFDDLFDNDDIDNDDNFDVSFKLDATPIPHWTYVVIAAQFLFILLLGYMATRKSSNGRNGPSRATRRNNVRNTGRDYITV